MAKQLSKLGVDIIEAGFPIALQGDFEVRVILCFRVQGLLFGEDRDYHQGVEMQRDCVTSCSLDLRSTSEIRSLRACIHERVVEVVGVDITHRGSPFSFPSCESQGEVFRDFGLSNMGDDCFVGCNQEDVTRERVHLLGDWYSNKEFLG